MINIPISAGVNFKFLLPVNQSIDMIETTSNHLIWIITRSILSKLHDRGLLDDITINMVSIDYKSISQVRLNHHLIKNDIDGFIMRLVRMVIERINLSSGNNITYISGSWSVRESHNALIKWVDVVQNQSSQMRCDFDNIIVLTNLFNVLNVSELIIT